MSKSCIIIEYYAMQTGNVVIKILDSVFVEIVFAFSNLSITIFVNDPIKIPLTVCTVFRIKGPSHKKSYSVSNVANYQSFLFSQLFALLWFDVCSDLELLWNANW